MLQLNKNSIADLIKKEDFKSFTILKEIKTNNRQIKILGVLILLTLLSMFLPWNQSVSSKGYVTTRNPDKRPQAINSVIGGKIEKWYVKEGDRVKKGDTIAYITEIKSEYFDPNLLERTEEQLTAKQKSADSYQQKAKQIDSQYSALLNSLDFKKKQTQNKIQQTKNKIVADSVDLETIKLNLKIAENQLSRTQDLYQQGLKSLSETQEKQLKVQELRAKEVSQENKLKIQRNELNNALLEVFAIENEYAEKLAKSKSDKQSAISAEQESVGQVSKLKNQLSNYSQRNNLYYILAPQSGIITKTLKKGLGEIIKEGADLATIVPSDSDLALEIYVKPQDLPLLTNNNRAAIRFDGWPAIVVSGWPEASTGIFQGEVVAIDQVISENGFYRIFISPAKGERLWPDNLRVGAGATAFILLKRVPICMKYGEIKWLSC